MNALTQLLINKNNGDVNAAEQEYMKIRQDSKYAKQFLSDNVKNFSYLSPSEQNRYVEKLSPRAGVLETTGTIVRSGLGGLQGAMAGISDALDLRNGENQLASSFREMGAYQDTTNPLSESNLRLGGTGRFLAKGAEMVGGMTPAIAAGIATANPFVAAGVGGVTEFGSSEDTARQLDMSPEQGRIYALGRGAVGAGMELLPFGKALSRVPKVGKTLAGLFGESSSAEATQRLAQGQLGLKQFGQRMIAEPTEEVATTILQREIDKANNVPVQGLGEAVAETASLTALVTGILGVGGVGNRMIRNRFGGTQQTPPVDSTDAVAPETGVGGLPVVRPTIFGVQETVPRFGQPQAAIGYNPPAIEGQSLPDVVGQPPQMFRQGMLSQQEPAAIEGQPRAMLTGRQAQDTTEMRAIEGQPIPMNADQSIIPQSNARLQAGEVIPMSGAGLNTPYDARAILEVIGYLEQNNIEPTATNIVSVMRDGNVTQEDVGTMQDIINRTVAGQRANMTMDDIISSMQYHIDSITGVNRQSSPQEFQGLETIDSVLNAERPLGAPQTGAIPMPASSMPTMVDLSEANMDLFDDNGRLRKGVNPERLNFFLEDAKQIVRGEMLHEQQRRAGMTQEEMMRERTRALPEEIIPMDEESIYRYHRRVLNQARADTPSLVQVIRNSGGIDTDSLRSSGIPSIKGSPFEGATKKGGLSWDKMYQELVSSGQISPAPVGVNPFDHLASQIAENKKIRSSEYIEAQARAAVVNEMKYDKSYEQSAEQSDTIDSNIFEQLPDCPF